MVVIERDGDACLLHGGAENVARGDGGVVHGSDEDLAAADDLPARVEEECAEALLAELRELADQIGADRLELELRALRKLLRREAAGDLEGRADARRLRLAHPVQPR